MKPELGVAEFMKNAVTGIPRSALPDLSRKNFKNEVSGSWIRSLFFKWAPYTYFYIY